MSRKVKLVLVGVGVASVAAVGTAVAAGDTPRWGAHLMKETRFGKWLNRRITNWALNVEVRHQLRTLPDADRERFLHDYEELCRERGMTPRKF